MVWWMHNKRGRKSIFRTFIFSIHKIATFATGSQFPLYRGYKCGIVQYLKISKV